MSTLDAFAESRLGAFPVSHRLLRAATLTSWRANAWSASLPTA